MPALLDHWVWEVINSLPCVGLTVGHPYQLTGRYRSDPQLGDMKIRPHKDSPSKGVWHRSTAAGRWYGFGRSETTAMFPQSFIHDAVINLTKPEETVLDPFCGRGNAPFAATVLGRYALGIDVNPIAWLFAAAKLQPAPTPEQVTARLFEIAKARRPSDRRSHSRVRNYGLVSCSTGTTESGAS